MRRLRSRDNRRDSSKLLERFSISQPLRGVVPVLRIPDRWGIFFVVVPSFEPGIRAVSLVHGARLDTS